MFIGGNSVGENHFYLSNLGLEHSEMKICVLPRNQCFRKIEGARESYGKFQI